MQQAGGHALFDLIVAGVMHACACAENRRCWSCNAILAQAMGFLRSGRLESTSVSMQSSTCAPQRHSMMITSWHQRARAFRAMSINVSSCNSQAILRWLSSTKSVNIWSQPAGLSAMFSMLG